MEYEHRGTVVEEGRTFHMRIGRDLTSNLGFVENQRLESSSIISKSPTNGLGDKEVKE